MCKNFHKTQLLIPTVLLSAELIVRISQVEWNEKNVFEVSVLPNFSLQQLKALIVLRNGRKQKNKLKADIRLSVSRH